MSHRVHRKYRLKLRSIPLHRFIIIDWNACTWNCNIRSKTRPIWIGRHAKCGRTQAMNATHNWQISRRLDLVTAWPMRCKTDDRQWNSIHCSTTIGCRSGAGGLHALNYWKINVLLGTRVCVGRLCVWMMAVVVMVMMCVCATINEMYPRCRQMDCVLCTALRKRTNECDRYWPSSFRWM